MQVQRTDISSTEIKLLITAESSELEHIKEHVVARLGKDVKLQGFRAGKAPRSLVEKNIDPALLQGDFLDEAMTQLYARATNQEKIRPVTRPSVEVKKFVPYSTLEYEVTTNIVGPVKLPDYSKLKVPRDPVKVTEKDVEGVVDSLISRMAEKQPVERASKKGDEAVIDFSGTDTKSGDPIQGGEGKDYPLELGSDAFIPGFEDNVIGMKKGDEKSFSLKFPKDYGVAALANKDVTFKVTLKNVNELVKPKADDELAKKIGPFKTLTELKEDIKKQLTVEREREELENYQNKVLKQVSDLSKVEIPQALIDQQVVYNIDEVRRNVTYRGQTFQEYLEAEGKTEEELKKELEPQALEQLKASLVLAEIAEVEELSIQPDELDIRIQTLKGQYSDPEMQSELDKPENRRDIASRMLSEKVINFLISTISQK